MFQARKLALVVATAATSLSLMMTGVGAARADITSVDQAKAEFQKLEAEVNQIGEQLDQVQQKLTTSQSRVATLGTDISTQQAKVDSLRGQAAQIALEQFQNRQVGTTMQLFTSDDPDHLMQALTTVRQVNATMNSQLQDFQTAQADLADLQRSAQSEQAALADQKANLTALQTKVQGKVDAVKTLMDRLTAEQQAQVDPVRAATTTSRDTTRSATVAAEAPGATVSGNASARALQAAKLAASKAGSSYVWGASGPNAFDCSGLMLWAYSQVGVSLPHSSQSQSGMGVPVAKADLQPGDLMFFYSPVSHVAMYIGNGLMVHARQPRYGVQITVVATYPSFVGARRVA